MLPEIVIPNEIKIKVNFDGLYALFKALQRFEAMNPVEYPIYFMDLWIYSTLKKVRLDLENKVLKCQHAGTDKITLKFSYFEVRLLADFIEVKRGDTLPLLNVVESIIKEALKFNHLVLSGNEEEPEQQLALGN